MEEVLNTIRRPIVVDVRHIMELRIWAEKADLKDLVVPMSLVQADP